MSESIVAIATSTATNASVNILRISGDDALKIAMRCFHSNKIEGEPMPNYMYLGRVSGKNFAEQAFCVYYKAPYSYTGENVVEIQCHGGRGVANAIFSLLVESGARPATAGEFTKRAFLNGKLNLLQAEGVQAMVNAESESQISQAYRQLRGELSSGIYASEEKLVSTIAGLEAKLDYPEEIEESFDKEAVEGITAVLGEIKKLLADAAVAKAVDSGVNVAIIGLPNVGKSSLLNALILADRAIVTDIAGTTRDVLKESVSLGGVRFNLLDTAGIREGGDVIERIGIERSIETAKGADIVIFVTDGGKEITDEERALERLLEGKTVVKVVNKSDILRFDRVGAIKIRALPPHDIEELKSTLLRLARADKIFSSAVIVGERQRFCLSKAKENLEEALEEFDRSPTECTLLLVRLALQELSKITGRNVSENIIEEVFSTFCVGK